MFTVSLTNPTVEFVSSRTSNPVCDSTSSSVLDKPKSSSLTTNEYTKYADTPNPINSKTSPNATAKRLKKRKRPRKKRRSNRKCRFRLWTCHHSSSFALLLLHLHRQRDFDRRRRGRRRRDRRRSGLLRLLLSAAAQTCEYVRKHQSLRSLRRRRLRRNLPSRIHDLLHWFNRLLLNRILRLDRRSRALQRRKRRVHRFFFFERSNAFALARTTTSSSASSRRTKSV